LGAGGKSNHVLRLRHVADPNPVEDIHALLDGVNLVPIEVGRAPLELREAIDRAQAALRAVDLLVEQAAQARRVEAGAPLTRRTSLGELGDGHG